MGKKILIGCLALLVVGTIGGGLAFYFWIYLPGRDYVASFAQLGQVEELNERIVNQERFVSDDELLEPGQVERFAAVQRAIRAGLGSRLQFLEQKYESVGRELESEARQPSISDLLTFLREVSQLYLEVKRLQVEALNEQGFSLSEYQWVRSRFYNAAGVNFFSFSLESLAEAVQKGEVPELGEELGADPVAQRNRQLAEPYQEEVPEWLAFAWLGI